MKPVPVNAWQQPLQIEDIPQPIPQSDEVLVRVHAASLNPFDTAVLAGYMSFMLTLPLTLGTDFAGEVVAVGADIQHVAAGDAVYGLVPGSSGTFAEFTIAKAHEVTHKPRSLDFIHASALPLPAMAAWQTLFDKAQFTTWRACADSRCGWDGRQPGGSIGQRPGRLCVRHRHPGKGTVYSRPRD